MKKSEASRLAWEKLSPEQREERCRRIREGIRARGPRRRTPEQNAHHSAIMTGRKQTAERVEQRSAQMRGRPMTSDNSRRGPDRHNGLRGVLIDPRGVRWEFRNLTEFVRTHEDLFSSEDVVWQHNNGQRCSFICRAYKGLGALFCPSNTTLHSWKGWVRG